MPKMSVATASPLPCLRVARPLLSGRVAIWASSDLAVAACRSMTTALATYVGPLYWVGEGQLAVRDRVCQAFRLRGDSKSESQRWLGKAAQLRQGVCQSRAGLCKAEHRPWPRTSRYDPDGRPPREASENASSIRSQSDARSPIGSTGEWRRIVSPSTRLT
jgi:hypothetical protein